MQAVEEMSRADLLQAIKPAVSAPHSDKFSRNLYNWQKRRKPMYDRVLCAQIVCPGFDHSHRAFNYEHGRPDLYFGFLPGEGWMHGTRVATILTGVQKETLAYPPGWEWMDVTDWFWREYLRIGRCFLHPEHDEFIKNGDLRWKYRNGGERECQWCGHVQAITTVTRVRQEWRPIEQVRGECTDA